MPEILTGKKAVIGQFGGPTSVINSTFISASFTLMNQGYRVLGAINGIEGIMSRRYHVMNNFSREGLYQIAREPGSHLLSSKYHVNVESAEQIAIKLKGQGIDCLYMIGGNSTAYIANLIADAAGAMKYDLRIYHMPKTVDNDLLVTDHCPGYGSAAKFISNIARGLDADNRTYGGITMMIVMGRDAGFLAYSAALAIKHRYSGPHLIYAPEREFRLPQFREDLENVLSETKSSRTPEGGEQNYGRALVVLSEGIWTMVDGVRTTMVDVALRAQKHRGVSDSNLGSTNLTVGSRDLAIYLEEKIGRMFPGLRLRTDIPGYSVRSNPMQSDVDITEAWYVGRKAVEYSITYGNGSVVLAREGGYDTYSVRAEHASLKSVAAGSRVMPDEFINKRGNFPTKQFVEYVRPLVQDFARAEEWHPDKSPYIVD